MLQKSWKTPLALLAAAALLSGSVAAATPASAYPGDGKFLCSSPAYRGTQASGTELSIRACIRSDYTVRFPWVDPQRTVRWGVAYTASTPTPPNIQVVAVISTRQKSSVHWVEEERAMTFHERPRTGTLSSGLSDRRWVHPELCLRLSVKFRTKPTGDKRYSAVWSRWVTQSTC